MPIYEYRCKSCEHEFEKFLRAGQDDPATCPECAREAVTRLISNTNFKLKGSGWYETDYAQDDESAGEESPEAASGQDQDQPQDSETSTDIAAE